MGAFLRLPLLQLTLCVGAIMASTPGRPSALGGRAAVIHDAATALQRSLKGGNAIPASIMRRAQAIAVFPAIPGEAIFHEGAGVVSGKSMRSSAWLPAVVSFKATLRFAQGRSVGDIVIVALTRKGFDCLAQSAFSLPRDTEIPPGPVGLNTTENMKTDFVAYARYRRYFAGITVEEVAIEEDAEALDDLYGPGLGLHEILNGRVRNGPPAALNWRDNIEAYFRELN